MTTSKPFIIIIWACQEMMAWISIYGCHLVGFWSRSWGKSQITADICQAPTTNLTHHNPYGPDDHLKTIDYHHLCMSRDDGMDEHVYGGLYGCHLVGFSWPRSWDKSLLISVKPRTQI
jgi:hypothetical protein